MNVSTLFKNPENPETYPDFPVQVYQDATQD